MMKKLILSFVLCTWSLCTWSNVETGVAVIPDNYYDQVDNKKSADNILNALNSTISSHTVLNYNALEDYYEQTDFYADTLWDMYSTCRFVMDDGNKEQQAVCDAWNKEHLVCQSWFSGSGMKSDLFNVYPTDARINGMRSNYPYGEVNGAYGTGISKNNGHALGKVGSNTFSGYSGTVFEPHDDYKGDFARSFMYMAACYRSGSLNAANGSAMYTAAPTNLTTYAQNLLMKWHRQDPVSQKEIDRNQAVYTVQGNRNPFIDYPYLAEFIWGTHAGETLDMSQLMPSTDPDFVPGASSGWRGDDTPPTPPVPAVKHGVNWFVNGVNIHTDSVAENSKPTTLPDEPASCSDESELFMGWTNSTIDGFLDEAPLTLYTVPKNMPAVTEDVNYYAVFAHMEVEESSEPQIANEKIVFKELNLPDQQPVTSVTQGYVTLTFTTGGSNATKYFVNGESIRLYAGNSMTVAGPGMTRINLEFGTGDKTNEISTDVGTFESPSWTGSADEVVFSVAGSKDHRRITSVEVIFNSTGSTVTYSRFITSCSATTAIDTPDKELRPARKVLIDGQLYLLVGETMYDITGRMINK